MDMSIEAATITRNVQSIRDVPATHISAETRLILLRRAAKGEDVYCYGNVNSPTGIINLWDTDTRIPFYPLVQERWAAPVIARQANSNQWHIELESTTVASLQRVVAITIDLHPWEVNTDIGFSPYMHRAGRVGRMVCHYINLYQDDPAKYNGCHF